MGNRTKLENKASPREMSSPPCFVSPPATRSFSFAAVRCESPHPLHCLSPILFRSQSSLLCVHSSPSSLPPPYAPSPPFINSTGFLVRAKGGGGEVSPTPTQPGLGIPVGGRVRGQQKNTRSKKGNKQVFPKKISTFGGTQRGLGGPTHSPPFPTPMGEEVPTLKRSRHQSHHYSPDKVGQLCCRIECGIRVPNAQVRSFTMLI